MALGMVAALAAAFYVVENWRGERAWAERKKGLEAQQESLDWAAYIPPAAPGESNFFKAPKMQEWFVGGGTNELTARLSLASFPALARQRANSNGVMALAELILRTPEDGAGTAGATPPPADIVPAIALDGVSLSEALQQLAQQANLKVQIDPQVSSGRAGPDGKPVASSLVTGHWNNVTASSVLLALLCNNNLRWVDNPKTGVALIQLADGAAPPAGAEPVGRDYVLGLILKANRQTKMATEGFLLSANPSRPSTAVRLSVAADSIPARNQMARLFPGASVVGVEPVSNSLRVVLGPVPVAAADYLEWSGGFSAEFDRIGEAVKRPAARLESDYEQLYRVPGVNYTAAGAAARMLADRAECFLMLGQPEAALRELTLLHDLRGRLECGPTGKPMRLSTAMGNMGMSGLYLEIMAYGLQLQAWREPELAALQDQLSRVELVALCWNALESERAGACHFFESAPRSEMARVLEVGGETTYGWMKISRTKRTVLRFMPGGWVYQNMARMAALDQNAIDSVDRLQDVVHPSQVDEAWEGLVATFHHSSPYSFLAKATAQTFKSALMATAHAQAVVNEAAVVCALERFRLARGEYPETLNALAPEFLRVLPVDPIKGGPLKYRRAGTGRFFLYSIGWNETDDNGAAPDAAGNGDWVWSSL
jgi:hypothetical protein